ncbi:MAG: glutamate formimidoyltransferase [Anaerolineales bacterium]|nr:glutamate formimidoyltransferase [Anaerolineales bacterium]
MSQLVECVPNFSEGRRPEVIAAIVAAMKTAGGAEVQVLDVSSDADHNRTVVTLVGSPAGVENAAFAAMAKAAELIDLNQHTGEHPRMGATDVVPFIPLRNVSMADCVVIARRLGERVGRELNIPVYLYEAAASRSERVNLAEVRKGQYEGIKAEIGVDPKRDPDFGPKQLGPAGCTAIGARQFLVAYNIYLGTSNVEIADKVAKAVRHLSGGLRFVKGKGFLVEGQAQVSMNLTDFTKTPIARVQEMVRREAARYGVSITHAELVGMIPQQALADAAQWYLQLDNLKPEMILENRLSAQPAAVAEDGATENETRFIERLAAATATPGGGAAAAYSAAMAAGLVGMVARLTIGKKKYESVSAEMTDVLEKAEALRAELTAAIEEDSASFNAVMAAFQLPKVTDEQVAARAAAVEQAYHGAAAVPLRVARATAKTLALAAVAAAKGNINAKSDAGSAAHLSRAAFACAALNVRSNASEVQDQAAAESWLKEIDELETQVKATLAQVEKTLSERK